MQTFIYMFDRYINCGFWFQPKSKGDWLRSYARLAQMGERGAEDLHAVGSSPTPSTLHL